MALETEPVADTCQPEIVAVLRFPPDDPALEDVEALLGGDGVPLLDGDGLPLYSPA